jgi:hypothetical protein
LQNKKSTCEGKIGNKPVYAKYNLQYKQNEGRRFGRDIFGAEISFHSIIRVFGYYLFIIIYSFRVWIKW